MKQRKKCCEIHAEIDDIARRQQIPGRPEIRIGKTGKLAVLVQRIDVHLLIRPFLRCVGYAHMVSGNAVSVPECAGVEALKPIQTIRFLVDNLAIDISLADPQAAGAASDRRFGAGADQCPVSESRLADAL